MSLIRRLAPAGLALLLAGCGESSAGLGAPTPFPKGPAPAAPAGPAAGPLAGLLQPGQIKELMAEGKKAADSGNLGGAARLFEEVVKADPTNREALYLLAVASQDRAMELERPRSSAPYLRSASAMRQLRAAYKSLTEDEAALYRAALFNEARTLAVEGKPEKALDSLAEAADAGFTGIGPLRSEGELEPVRKLPRYQEIVAKVERQTRALARVAAQSLLAKNQPFFFSFKLPGLDDKVVSSDDLKGKVVVADMWGTWCPPCRKEIPHLVELSKKYKEKGLQVVGLNYEKVPDDEIKKTIADFVKEAGVTYPCLIGDEKTMEQVPKFQGFPTTLVLDRSGKVRARLTGFDPDDHVAIMALEELVETLLAE